MAGTVHDVTERKLAEEHLRDLSHRLLSAQESERRSLARELHDEIGQVLTTLKISLARIQRGGDRVPTELEQAQEVLGDLIGRVRNLSLNLSPSMLADIGLLATLQWYLKSYASMTGTKVSFRHAGLRRAIPQETSLAAYRTIQEALTNVARHAGTGEVMLSIRAVADVLTIEIEDHGVGFDASAFDKPAAGLMGIRERVNALDGRFELSSSPGVGTYLAIEFPLPALPSRRRKRTKTDDKHGSSR
jgi:signal transduction histidine kinase